jgi:hypothetical protein
MSDVTKTSVLGIDTNSAMRCVIVSELFAGEALAKLDAVRIDSDGTVMKAVSTQCTISGEADFDGIVDRVYATGQPVTIFGQGVVCRYATGMTPGMPLWVSSNAGLLSDAKVASADEPVAKAISATDIKVIK